VFILIKGHVSKLIIIKVTHLTKSFIVLPYLTFSLFVLLTTLVIGLGTSYTSSSCPFLKPNWSKNHQYSVKTVYLVKSSIIRGFTTFFTDPICTYPSLSKSSLSSIVTEERVLSTSNLSKNSVAMSSQCESFL